MLELLKSGEPFLFANMFVALVALTIAIQRFHALWMKFGRSVEEMLKDIFGHLESGSFARALQLCNANDHPINSVFKAALLRANRSEKEIRRAFYEDQEDAVERSRLASEAREYEKGRRVEIDLNPGDDVILLADENEPEEAFDAIP